MATLALPHSTSSQVPPLPDDPVGEVEDIIEDPVGTVSAAAGEVAAVTDALTASVPSIYSCVRVADGSCGNQKVTNTAVATGTDVDVDGDGSADVTVAYSPANLANIGTNFTVTVTPKNPSDPPRARIDLVVNPPDPVVTPREFVYVGVDGLGAGLPAGYEARIDYALLGGNKIKLTPTVDGIKGKNYGVRGGAFDTDAIEPRPRRLAGEIFYLGSASKQPPASPVITVNPAAGSAKFEATASGAGTDMVLRNEDAVGASAVEAKLTRVPQEMEFTKVGNDDFPGVTYTSVGTNPSKLGRLEVKVDHTGPAPIQRCTTTDTSTGQPDIGVIATEVPNSVDARSIDNDTEACNAPDPSQTKIHYGASAVIPSVRAVVDANTGDADLTVSATKIPTEVDITATKGDRSRVVYAANGSLGALSALVRGADAFAAVSASGSSTRPFPTRVDVTSETVAGDCDRASAKFGANARVANAKLLARSNCDGQPREVFADVRSFQNVAFNATEDSMSASALPPIGSLKVRSRLGAPFVTAPLPEQGKERDALRFSRIRFRHANTPNQLAVDSRGAAGQELQAQVASLRRMSFDAAPMRLDLVGGGGGRFAFDGKIAAQSIPGPCGQRGIRAPDSTILGRVDRLPGSLEIEELDCGSSYRYEASQEIPELQIGARTTPAPGAQLTRPPRTPEEALNGIPLRLGLIVNDVPKKVTFHTNRAPGGKTGFEASSLAKVGQIQFLISDGGGGANHPASENSFRVHLREDDLRAGRAGWLNVSGRVHDLKSAIAVPDRGNVQVRSLSGTPKPVRLQESDIQLGDAEENPVIRVNASVPSPPKRVNVTLVPPQDDDPLVQLKLDNSADIPRLKFRFRRAFGSEGPEIVAAADIRDITAKTDICLDAKRWACGPTIQSRNVSGLGNTRAIITNVLTNVTLAADVKSTRIRNAINMKKLRLCAGDVVVAVGDDNCRSDNNGVRIAARDIRFTDVKFGLAAGDLENPEDRCRPRLERVVAFGLDEKPVSIGEVIADVQKPGVPGCPNRKTENVKIKTTAPHLPANERLRGFGFVALGPVPTGFGPTHKQGRMTCGDLKIEAAHALTLGAFIEGTGEVTQGECR